MADLLTIEQFLKKFKSGKKVQIKKGGIIFTLPMLIYAVSELKKLLGVKKQSGGSATLSSYKKAVNKLKNQKLGNGIKIYRGGFIFTLATLFSALAALGSIAGGTAAITSAVHNKEKNDAELEEQKRHNLAMESTGSSIKKRTKNLISHL